MRVDPIAEEKKAAPLFEELGRFIHAFELQVYVIRGICAALISQNDGNRQILMNVILNHQAMTAQALFECMRGMLVEFLVNVPNNFSKEERTTLAEILQQMGKEFKNLCERRNEIVHGTWLVSGDQSHLMKPKVSGVGLKYPDIPSSPQELRALRRRCSEFSRFANALSLVLLPRSATRGAFDVSRQFKKVNGTWQVVSGAAALPPFYESSPPRSEGRS